LKERDEERGRAPRHAGAHLLRGRRGRRDAPGRPLAYCSSKAIHAGAATVAGRWAIVAAFGAHRPARGHPSTTARAV